MNYGEKAKELILQLKRSEWLPAYNEEGVRSSLVEISMHFDELNDQLYASSVALATVKMPSGEERPKTDYKNGSEEYFRTNNITSDKKVGRLKLPMESRPAMILHDAAIRRIKRCLLGYHAHRLDKLKFLKWETNASLPLNIRTLLSDAEVDFFTDYDRLVSRYSSTFPGSDGFLLDLNANMQPPEEDMIEVRVVRDGIGTIVTEHWGEVSLDIGTTHFLCRGDVEQLIRQGMLQQLDSEEIF